MTKKIYLMALLAGSLFSTAAYSASASASLDDESRYVLQSASVPIEGTNEEAALSLEELQAGEINLSRIPPEGCIGTILHVQLKNWIAPDGQTVIAPARFLETAWLSAKTNADPIADAYGKLDTQVPWEKLKSAALKGRVGKAQGIEVTSSNVHMIGGDTLILDPFIYINGRLDFCTLAQSHIKVMRAAEQGISLKGINLFEIRGSIFFSAGDIDLTSDLFNFDGAFMNCKTLTLVPFTKGPIKEIRVTPSGPIPISLFGMINFLDLSFDMFKTGFANVEVQFQQ